MPMTLTETLEAKARTVKTTKMAMDILSSKCKTKVTTQIWVDNMGAQWIIMV